MILDTNAVSDLFSGSDSLGRRIRGEERHHLPVMVLGEYRYGVLRSNSRSLFEQLIARLERESYVLSPDGDTATAYAQVKHRLREKGAPIPENDIWIAALAIQHQLAVVSKDKHFDRVKGVRRIAW